MTTYGWTRSENPATTPMLPNVWNRPGGSGVGAPALPGAWTLRRTMWDVVLKVRVNGGSGLSNLWWVASEVRVGLKFSPDGSVPGMARNDESPEVLAIQSLYPTFYGDPTGGNDHTVVYRQARPLDVRTARRDDGHGGGVVYTFFWATDLAGVFTAGGPPVFGYWYGQLSALWSQP